MLATLCISGFDVCVYVYIFLQPYRKQAGAIFRALSK